MKRICIYCASSPKAADIYKDSASDIARILVKNGYEIVYGGGSIGLMGAVADSVLANNGKITGVIPAFMQELEWGHPDVEMIEVTNMHERKSKMLEISDGVIALAGGCGTFEEIMEAITWKRLGLYTGPAVFLNTNNYYDPIIQQLDKAVDENFMNPEHRSLWSVIQEPEEVIEALKNHIILDNPLSRAAVK
ncbi:MAG: TIGR00730 family Rossman fold protein [Lentisphaeraceae bacterium]|nr:TIGR00730 family Rossman fold protein [Lentisphaeraceae bacterium]